MQGSCDQSLPAMPTTYPKLTNKPQQFDSRHVLPVALFLSREVLHVALLFLRVISACADGKIRIYNFLNGNCLKVMKANGRGDPVLSFFIQGNRWVVGVEVRALSSFVWMIFFSSGTPALHLPAVGESGCSPYNVSCRKLILWL